MAARRQIDSSSQPVLRSQAMREIDRLLRVVALKEVAITLVGESGTGKEVLARRVHELSPRHEGPFLPINCAAIPEALFESELFGHERGAFTGANQRAYGKLEAASGGTLFLDEIGEMPLTVQAKLLRFLEGRKFMRVGGTQKISVDTRLVCATLRPLEKEVAAGRFRADLFYRIQGVPLVVPPLRARQADIPALIERFVEELCARHAVRPPKITREALAALMEYSWPGNVRELRNAIELVCLLREGKPVRRSDLPEALRVAPAPAKRLRQSTLEVDLTQTLDQIVDGVLAAVIELEGGKRARAARRLGISLRTIQRRLAH